MFTDKRVITTIIVFLSLVFVYLIRDNDFTVSDPDLDMAEGSSIPIEVSLSSEISSNSIHGSAKLRMTLTNTSPDEIYLLRWSSPLDTHASAIGIVSFISSKTGNAARCLNMKIKHRMPTSGYFLPDDQSIVHIPPQGKVDTVVDFKEPEVALINGEEYRVKASGRWMGVWVFGASDSMEKLRLDDEMNIGEFESNEIVIRVPGEDAIQLK